MTAQQLQNTLKVGGGEKERHIASMETKTGFGVAGSAIFFLERGTHGCSTAMSCKRRDQLPHVS